MSDTTTEKTNLEKVWDASSRTPMLKAELADKAGVTVQAVTAAVKKLTAAGVLQVSEQDAKMVLRVKGVRSLPAELKGPAPRRSRADAPAAAEALADTFGGAIRTPADALPAPAPADSDPVAERAAVLAKLPKAELVKLAEGVGFATHPKQTRTQLAELIAVKEGQLAAGEEAAEAVEVVAQVVDGLTGTETKAPAERKLQAHTIPELMEIAQGLGIAFGPREKKASLIRLIEVRRAKLADAASASSPTGVAVIVNGEVVTAESDVETPEGPEGPWGTPDPDAVPTDDVGAVLAELQAARPVSAPPAQGVSRRAEAGGVFAVKGNKATQWGRGELAAAIDKVFADRGPEVDFTATDMTRALNQARTSETDPIAQSGAVKYALNKKVEQGTARMTSETPKRYGRSV